MFILGRFFAKGFLLVAAMLCEDGLWDYGLSLETKVFMLLP